MENLHPELIEIILKLLTDRMDIECAADVCQSWRAIITTSKPLMKRLTYEFDGVRDKDPKPLKLPYVNYSLRRMKADTVIPMDSNRIQNLSIENSLDWICGMSFPNLTSLSVGSPCEKFDINLKIDFPNLTDLISCVCQLPVIRSHKISSLCLSANYRHSDRAISRYFGKFLATCSDLKHMAFADFYSNKIEKLENQLESLDLIYDKESPVEFNQNLFESQRASLKCLRIDIEDPEEDEDNLSDFIYHEMNLEKFIDRRLHRGELKESKNVKVKNLELLCRFYEFPFVQKLLPGCQDLEDLNINLIKGKELEMLQLISQLPKLKSLKITGSYERVLDLQFPQLEELAHFHGLSRYHISMVYGCPKLRRLVMRVDLTKETFERIFQCCPKIEEIDLMTIRLSFFNRVTAEMLEAFEYASSRITLKCNVDEWDIGEFAQVKNRLIINT